jgi:integrase
VIIFESHGSRVGIWKRPRTKRTYELAVARVDLHDLRRTFATYLVAKGTDVKTVSSLMGHANAAMTLNVYASADPDARLAAGRVVAEAMAERPTREETPRRPLLRVV